jgi:hypothetical protein
MPACIIALLPQLCAFLFEPMCAYWSHPLQVWFQVLEQQTINVTSICGPSAIALPL